MNEPQKSPVHIVPQAACLVAGCQRRCTTCRAVCWYHELVIPPFFRRSIRRALDNGDPHTARGIFDAAAETSRRFCRDVKLN